MTVGRFDSGLSLRGLFSGEHRKATLILLLAPLLITTWKYFGTTSFYLERLTGVVVFGGDTSFTAEVYAFVSTFMLFALVPWGVIRFGFRERMRDYGWQLGDWEFGWKAAALMAPIMVLFAIASASAPEFIAQYPFDKGAGSSGSAFLVHAIVYLLFYVGWETLFRGFMQFGLRSLGDWNAILIQTAMSCVAHVGKPAVEVYSSILGALVWGVVAFRSRSLLYVLIVHWLLGVSLDWFILFR